MYNGRKILAVVPARGGSKGIPKKNLMAVGGQSLISRVGSVIHDLPIVDRSVVSTDSEEIASVAEAAGISAPFRRPSELSGDRIGDLDVLAHALQTMDALDGTEYDVVLMLQPTSPLRTAQIVLDCVVKMVSGGWDSVWTVSETDSKNHPLKQLRMSSVDGTLDYFDPLGSAVMARQELEPLYHRNGMAYAISRECILVQKKLMGRRSSALLVEGVAVSIDTYWDLALVELALSQASSN